MKFPLVRFILMLLQWSRSCWKFHFTLSVTFFFFQDVYPQIAIILKENLIRSVIPRNFWRCFLQMQRLGNFWGCPYRVDANVNWCCLLSSTNVIYNHLYDFISFDTDLSLYHERHFQQCTELPWFFLLGIRIWVLGHVGVKSGFSIHRCENHIIGVRRGRNTNEWMFVEQIPNYCWVSFYFKGEEW